jgi:hypothetical protein
MEISVHRERRLAMTVGDTVIARSPQGDAAIQGQPPQPFVPWIASSLRSSQ